MDRYIEAWGQWLTDVRNVRSSTWSMYTETAEKLEQWLGHADWNSVTAQQIEAFMSRPRRSNKPPSPATQQRDRASIGVFFRWLQSRGVITASPMVDVGVPRVHNRLPKPIPDPVWAQLWSSPQVPEEDKVWLGLGCYAGLRRREIVSLAPEQVDHQRGVLLYLERKGGSDSVVEFADMARMIARHLPRVLPNPEWWIAAVGKQALARRGERCLITMDLPASRIGLVRASFDDDRLPEPHVINNRLKKLIRATGIPPFSPHALRHTAATNLLRCGLGMDMVADLLDHSNIDTTRRYVKTAGRLKEYLGRGHGGSLDMPFVNLLGEGG